MAQELTSLAALQAHLKKDIALSKAALPPSSSAKISLRTSSFDLPDGQSPTEIDVVVVGYRYVNTLYTKRFVPGQIESPDCWAIGDDSADLAPDDRCAKPFHAQCGVSGKEGCCPKNEWKSAAIGNGKACANKIRIAVVPTNADDKAQVMYIDLPPTSTKSFEGELRKLLSSEVHPSTVVFHLAPDLAVDYPKVIFSVISQVPESIVPHIQGLRAKAIPVLDRGFDFN